MADEILIGTVGWRHAAWRDRFYPEELPADWEFCYYSNRLRAVWVPADEVARVDAAEVEAWVRDSDPAFRFVLGVAEADVIETARFGAFRARLAPLAGRIAGVVLSAPVRDQANSEMGEGARRAPAESARVIAPLQTLAPVCVETADNVAHATEATAVARVWEVERDETPPWRTRTLAADTVCIARMAGGQPRAIRHALEQLAAAPSATAGLFFTPSAAAADYAEQARTLAELLGL